MYTESDFKKEVRGLLDPANNTAQHIEACWQVYNNAATTRDGKIVAGSIEDLHEALQVFGPTNTSDNGSVLRTNTWSIILNDSWILGAVHAKAEVELVSRPISSTIANQNYKSGDPLDRIFRVTGRELIGLKSFGYSVVQGPLIYKSHTAKVINMMSCIDHRLAESATFSKYKETIIRQAGIMAYKGIAAVNSFLDA
ncbi:hypothetical protein [Microbulbifer sp. THAF38]|uniref:hypothetical protein n=1 Tax=Microbulbifer sp. THAF38 TaxID=2587856 RepID=UPI001268657C|nr:hypothetical protein [Microbulbifer sp. THAF38]QFT54397.1 hypothetical protein FIU95_07490 [Microbulbifer sp. THAF38]